MRVWIGRVVRQFAEHTAFWAAFALGAISLAGALLNPVVGLVLAVMFGFAAWGIWFEQAGAAAAAALLAGSPCISVLLGIYEYRVPLGSVPISLWISLAVGMGFAILFLFFAIRFFRRAHGRRRIYLWVCAIAAGTLFALFTTPCSTPTAGMADTILAGEQIVAQNLTTRLNSPLKLGQIVVFHFPVDPRQVFVKRIEGLPGDRIRILHKDLYRNGSAVIEGYAVHKLPYEDSFRDNFPSPPDIAIFPPGREMLKLNVNAGEVVVPPGKYFVLGDNRDQSLDSRYWGFISKQDIVGWPLFIYGSYDGENGQQVASMFNTRWSRLFKRPE